MLQLLIQWLPGQVGEAALAIALSGAAVGAVLWLSGARFSRTIIGLAAVLIGAVLGMELPRWMGWSISGAGPAVAFSLAFGLAGYICHRLWIGIGLGIVLCGWAFLATWVMLKAPATFNWPAAGATVRWSDYIAQLWQSLPPEIARVLPVTCGVAMLIGLITTIFWPRLAIASAWSAAGASLLGGLGSAAMQYGRPEWIRMMPQQLSSQILALGVLVMVGVAAQWKSAQAVAGQSGPIGGKPGSSASGKGKPSPRPVAEGAD